MESIISSEDRVALDKLGYVPMKMNITHTTNEHELKACEFDGDALVLLWYEDTEEEGFIYGVEMRLMESKKNKNVSIVRVAGMLGSECAGQAPGDRNFLAVGEFFFRTFQDALSYLKDKDSPVVPLTEEEVLTLASSE